MKMNLRFVIIRSIILLPYPSKQQVGTGRGSDMVGMMGVVGGAGQFKMGTARIMEVVCFSQKFCEASLN